MFSRHYQLKILNCQYLNIKVIKCLNNNYLYGVQHFSFGFQVHQIGVIRAKKSFRAKKIYNYLIIKI